MPTTIRWRRLPLSAVLNRGNGASIYLVDDTNALVLRPVTVRLLHRGHPRSSTSGLRNGDKVVTLGVQKLEAGLKVRHHLSAVIHFEAVIQIQRGRP